MILTLDIIQNVVMVLWTFGCRKLVHIILYKVL